MLINLKHLRRNSRHSPAQTKAALALLDPRIPGHTRPPRRARYEALPSAAASHRPCVPSCQPQTIRARARGGRPPSSHCTFAGFATVRLRRAAVPAAISGSPGVDAHDRRRGPRRRQPFLVAWLSRVRVRRRFGQACVSGLAPQDRLRHFSCRRAARVSFKIRRSRFCCLVARDISYAKTRLQALFPGRYNFFFFL